jgi:ElaB/YqjD/DUF883 family membrane-anchored ribosome-binding protein
MVHGVYRDALVNSSARTTANEESRPAGLIALSVVRHCVELSPQGGVSNMLSLVRSETMLARHGANGSVDKAWRDLQELQNDVVKLAQELPSMLNQAGDGSLRAARERVDRMKKTIDVSLAQLTDSGRNAAQSVNEMTHSIEETFRAHPIAVIVAAVGVGYMLGLSTQSSNHR